MNTCQVIVNIFVMILIMSGSLSGEIEYQVLSKQNLTYITLFSIFNYLVFILKDLKMFSMKHRVYYFEFIWFDLSSSSANSLIKILSISCFLLTSLFIWRMFLFLDKNIVATVVKCEEKIPGQTTLKVCIMKKN